MSQPSLKELIAAMEGEGTTHSQGDFTLTPGRALEKLSQFQLEEPLHYVLNLVASAVHAGAVKLKVWGDADDLVMEHDGLSPKEDELHQLFAYALADGPVDVWLKELAIGLHAARALKPTRLRLESGDSRVYLENDRI